jgi:hypothetical protein
MGGGALSIVERRCYKCRQILPIGSFHKNSGEGRHANHFWCKKCRCAAESQRRKDPAWIEAQAIKKAGNLPWRANELIRNIRKRCKREGWEFDLTPEWLLAKFQAGICEVSGLKFDFSAVKGPFTPSVDRVTAGAGYSKTNCRVVLMCVNSALMWWGIEAFIPVARAIAEKHPK